jgi:hypothetical protein
LTSIGFTVIEVALQRIDRQRDPLVAASRAASTPLASTGVGAQRCAVIRNQCRTLS